MLDPLIEAALLDQERRILQATPSEIAGRSRVERKKNYRVGKWRNCAACPKTMPANSPYRRCRDCRSFGSALYPHAR